MNFPAEALAAIFKVGLPVGALSFGLTWWVLKRGYVSGSEGVNALNAEIKALARERKKSKRRTGRNEDSQRKDWLRDKWFAFGGGFYGLVALYTYGMVEFRELSQIIGNLGGLGDFLRQLNVGTIVAIFIESLLNFVTAVTWPVYWLNEIATGRVWLWLGIAYGAYWLGIRFAQRAYARAARPAAHDPSDDAASGP